MGKRIEKALGKDKASSAAERDDDPNKSPGEDRNQFIQTFLYD